jgi:AraC-like DNA-binding protein/quercetin dioxygenase-like cupin family protein
MKPIYEEIQPSFGSSFTIRRFTEENCSNLPYWHVHPEYEIVYISNGKGKRQIGGHLSYYEDGDLIFLGPNLPHLGFAQDLWEQHVEIVVQMKENFLGNDFFDRPEMAEVKQLFERAKAGATFYGRTKWEIGQRLQNMLQLDHFDRLLELLKILQMMARSNEYNSLNINHVAFVVKPQEQQRIQAVYEFVERHFNRQFAIEEVAQGAGMTVPAFCRFFKRLTHKTFIEFLNEYRIAHACRLLSGEHLGTVDVSFRSGFNNLSHFNKQFKLLTGLSPTAYRKQFRQFIQTPVTVVE